jgi:[acyl-carrier-protein] S-malonyltransferase
MPERIAFLFPGQGSQVIGMGRDLAERSQRSRELLRQLDEICEKPLTRLCFEGPMEELTQTVNLQPALTAINLLCLSALRDAQVTPVTSAGHSLGEYAALVSAGVITEIDALRLARKRGELMQREADRNPGSMAAIMGLSYEEVAEVVQDSLGKGILGVANHNTSQQVVITGQKEPLAYAVELAKKKGGKAMALNVSGAWHSPLMEKAVEDFREFMAGVTFRRPQSTILLNATAAEETDPEKIKEIMARQLVSPVKWYDITVGMLRSGVETFVEVGPKNVLSGLVRKTLPRESQAKVFTVGDLKELDAFLNRSA